MLKVFVQSICFLIRVELIAFRDRTVAVYGGRKICFESLRI